MLTFIDTNMLAKVKTPRRRSHRDTEPGVVRRQKRGGGAALAEIGREIQRGGSDKHQLLYLMEGEGKHSPQ